MKPRIRTLLILATLAPALAHAHPGHEGGHDFGWDFSAGITHSLLGWDHLLAMVAVGLLAARQAGPLKVLLPVCFVGTLSLGAVATRLGLPALGAEQAIAASLILLGLGLALTSPPATAAAMALVALFGFAHGMAHGAEVPSGAGFTEYAFGFALASALLHTLGWLAGRSVLAGRGARLTLGSGLTLAGVVAMLT